MADYDMRNNRMNKDDIKQLAKKAQERPDIRTKIDFGENESEENRFIVRFEEKDPRRVTNPNPQPGMKPTFLSINVSLLEPSAYQNAGEGYVINTGEGGTLGDAILKIWAEGETLQGKVAEINTVYTHIKKVNKKARVYNVRAIRDWKAHPANTA